MDYGTWVGLSLNANRVRLLQASTLAQAMGAAQSTEPLGRDWADALAAVPELVDEVLYQTNAARKDAMIKSKLGWGQ